MEMSTLIGTLKSNISVENLVTMGPDVTNMQEAVTGV